MPIPVNQKLSMGCSHKTIESLLPKSDYIGGTSPVPAHIRKYGILRERLIQDFHAEFNERS